MYDEIKSTSAAYLDGPKALRPERPEGPLTVEVMQALDQAQSTANEIQARLFGLRDRLFGSSPEAAIGSLTSQRDPSSFKDAHAERATSLNRTLNFIDSISADIANRL